MKKKRIEEINNIKKLMLFCKKYSDIKLKKLDKESNKK